MRVLILGGDGYLGWPTAMHLTAKGHDVAVADNYLRRRLCREANTEPLFEVPDLEKRVGLWKSVSGYNIPAFIGDLREWDFVKEVFRGFTPDAIVHYAEQPSAPRFCRLFGGLAEKGPDAQVQEENTADEPQPV